MICFAVLGCGWVSRVRAWNVEIYPCAALVSCDAITKIAESTAAMPGTEAAGPVEEMLADARIEAVPVALSADNCVGLIARATQAGRVVLSVPRYPPAGRAGSTEAAQRPPEPAGCLPAGCHSWRMGGLVISALAEAP